MMPTFFGVDGMDGILAVEGFDTSLAEGVMLLTPFSAAPPMRRPRLRLPSIEERYGDDPQPVCR